MRQFHESAAVISHGTATVYGRSVDAALVRNLYGQELVWGDFSTKRGKFLGKPSNTAATEGVRYVSRNGREVSWSPPFGDPNDY